ncbi:hypothetical protein RRG08_033917 [Elysia crispata]|uniref:Uncharacterized protein n=1 Tax=Elysia crispata TaxID=231223 RepID=A0AAE1ED85_9GAST|nr:hypothetical protein RRG08_033917 [Elysia crispata]
MVILPSEICHSFDLKVVQGWASTLSALTCQLGAKAGNVQSPVTGHRDTFSQHVRSAEEHPFSTQLGLHHNRSLLHSLI